MKYIKHIFRFLVLLLIACSCEKELPFNPVNNNPKLVLYSMYNLDSEYDFTIHASKSTRSDISHPQFHVDSTQLQMDLLSSSNENIATFNYTGCHDYSHWRYIFEEELYSHQIIDSCYMKDIRESIYTTTLPGNGVNQYKICAQYPGLATVWTTVDVPNKVSIKNIETEMKFEKDEYSSYIHLVANITFDDDPDEDNYYQLEGDGYLGMTLSSWEGFPEENENVIEIQRFSSNSSFDSQFDPSIKPKNDDLSYEDMNEHNVFTDELFNGKKHTIKFVVGTFTSNYTIDKLKNGELDTENGEFIFVRVGLKSISKDQYLYIKSYSKYEYVDGDLFVEPVQVHSNVTNGLGIITIYREDTKNKTQGEYPKDGIEYIGSGVDLPKELFEANE